MASGKYEALEADVGPTRSSLKSAEKQLEDLEQDMWSLTVMLITKDFADLTHGIAKGFQKVRLAFGFFAQALNLTLQMYILYCVHDYVVGPAVHRMQADYQRFHAEVFDPDGTFRTDLWHVWEGPWMKLCSSSMTKATFTGVIIFLWSTQMLGEFRSVMRFQRRISSLPSKPDNLLASDMVHELDDEDGNAQFHIIFLTGITRFTLYVFVYLPRLSVCLVLWYVGCRWLNATESFGDLILNALALEFIISIDELILNKFFPDRILAYIDSTKFAYVKKEASDGERKQAILDEYFRSSVYAVMVIAWTCAYLTELQQVLPGFKHDINEHCLGPWFLDKFKVACESFETGCFPYGPKNGHPLPVPGGDRLL